MIKSAIATGDLIEYRNGRVQYVVRKPTQDGISAMNLCADIRKRLEEINAKLDRKI